MSFGFGIGDIIACSEVAWKTINALKSAGSDFEGLRLDLASLTSVLQALEAEAKGPMPLIKTASMERQNQMRILLYNCTESMKDLQGVVGKYSGWGADKKRDFVAWMKFAAKDKRGPREKLAIHTASINIFLTTLSHGSLARLEFLIKNGSQAAHQGHAPDGTKGLDFSAATTPWGMSHGHSKRNDNVIWQDIGKSLQREGITDKDIEAFQEEIKAYARYLVRGETPFWKESMSRSRSDEVHRVADTVPASALFGSSAPIYEDEARRLALRAEVKQARQVQRLDTDDLAELESEMRRMKLEAEIRKTKAHEDDMRLRKEVRGGREETIKREEDVASLAYKFESLFDFDTELAHAPPEAPDHQPTTVPAPVPMNDDVKTQDLEMRNARVYKINKRIEKLLDRRERYVQEGRLDEMAELEANDIPEQVKLLKLERVAVSHERAWRWNYWCDVCTFRIPSDHYHCTQCRGGNWDICQECWDKGARCSGHGNHRIIFSGRSSA
ncbi:hypothetical protein J7T55_013245 [Diaporthe amygdali]|uniref:uncharacterized protein n=1 Tax=Phomopsis amygdali TaxID=1214568 RepID=UPI0022FECD9E|nr:uncharacterized protein J7T55_013245 [Diaporthe amygdali]KAJ0119010.1 hypothetical protein J7T55_013245 [Diaporthe amygdali]